MKAAICYYSHHHGNTLKVVRAMAQGRDVDLIDVLNPSKTDLQGYDLIGFASGIYGFAFHPSVVEFAKAHLPEGKRVFFVYTCAGAKGTGTKAAAAVAREKHAVILGEFGCRGYNTFGPFKLIGGSGKGLPSEADLQRAKAFMDGLCAEE